MAPRQPESILNNLFRLVGPKSSTTKFTFAEVSDRQRTLAICCHLVNGKLRFGQLKKYIPNITERMLTLYLGKMEQNKLVKRTVYAEVPPRVEYKLTIRMHYNKSYTELVTGLVKYDLSFYLIVKAGLLSLPLRSYFSVNNKTNDIL